MPTQYPTLSINEATQRWSNMAKQNLFPYMYMTSGSFLTSSFANGPTPEGFSYLTLPFQADNNLAISNLEISFSGVPKLISAGSQDSRGTGVIQVSYANVLNTSTSASSATPIPPNDIGNIIYTTYFDFKSAVHTGVISGVLYADPVTVNDFDRYEPYNYLVKYNQIVYIHIGMSFTGQNLTGPDGTWLSSVIFHCLDTGLKT